MIKNLNVYTFSEFGTILSDRLGNRGFPKHGKEFFEQIVAVHASHYPLNYLDADRLYLDYDRGNTVLAVSHTPNNPSLFYLDKPVMLSRGIYFCLFPLLSESTVRISCSTNGRWIPQKTLIKHPEVCITNRTIVTKIFSVFYQEKEAGFFFKGECHNAMEILYVVKGAMHSIADGVESILNQGEMVIYGENQHHVQYADMDKIVTFVTIAFLLNSPYKKAMINHKFTLDKRESEILRQMIEDSSEMDEYCNDMLFSKLQLLLLSVLRSDCNKTRPVLPTYSDKNRSDIMIRILSFISNNLYNDISVKSVAKANNISSSYMSCIFREELNVSPGLYIRRAKLQESKELLRSGINNISQIADLLKYSSVFQFSRQFKTAFGISPSQYAKSIHTGERENMSLPLDLLIR